MLGHCELLRVCGLTVFIGYICLSVVCLEKITAHWKRVLRNYLMPKGFCQAHGQMCFDAHTQGPFFSLSFPGGAGTGVSQEAALCF